jgi:hypothetical protein
VLNASINAQLGMPGTTTITIVQPPSVKAG